MKVIHTVELKPGSYEEQLPDFRRISLISLHTWNWRSIWGSSRRGIGIRKSNCFI